MLPRDLDHLQRRGEARPAAIWVPGVMQLVIVLHGPARRGVAGRQKTAHAALCEQVDPPVPWRRDVHERGDPGQQQLAIAEFGTVGAGIDIVPATIELDQNIVFGTDPVGNAHLGGSAVGFGWRAGVMYKPASAPRLAFGAMWRSNVTENFDGNANFTAAPEYGRKPSR